MTDVLRVENLSHIYSRGTPFEKMAVDGVDFSVPAGEIVGLIGHTGSGKSTLVQHFNGLLKPHTGRVLINGEDIWHSKDMTRAARFAVGLVFQYPKYQLFEETTYKDIAFGPKNMGLSPDEIDRRVRRAAQIVGLPEPALDKSPFELSGGQKRRAALAGVFAMEPEVLVLDEPMAGLDPKGRDEVFGFIREYHRDNKTTVIFVTHSMEDAAKMAHRLVVMAGGKILMQGGADEVFSRAQELIASGLDVPQVTRVFLKMRELGRDFGEPVYTVDQAVNAIMRAKEAGHD